MTNRRIRIGWTGVLTILIGMTACLCACTVGKPQAIYAIEQNERYGFINTDGDTIVPCRYDMAFTDTIRTIGFAAENGQIWCLDNRGNVLFETFNFDNGPDWPSEGLFRFIGKDGRIGFADTLGKIIIPAAYRFAYPFKGGKAKVTYEGQLQRDSTSEHTTWVSPHWMMIDRNGK